MKYTDNINLYIPNENDDIDVLGSMASNFEAIDRILTEQGFFLETSIAEQIEQIENSFSKNDAAMYKFKSEITEISNRYKNMATAAIEIADTVQREFNRIIADGNSNAEVVQARGEEVNLNARLNKFTSQLANTNLRINNGGFWNKTQTGIIAHRGEHVRAPENTVKAIEVAGREGYEICELDVQMTSDGVAMLMHDDTVDRTTNGTGMFADMTFSKVSSLIVDENFVGKDNDEIIRVPTFEEACSECSKWDMGINVDGSKMIWNEEKFHLIVRLLKKYGIYNKSFFVLANKSDRLLLTSLYPDACVTWLTTDTNSSNNIQECNNYLNAFVTYSNAVITDSLINAYKNANIPIFVHSANNLNDVYKYFSKGVRFVETDLVLTGGVVS